MKQYLLSMYQPEGKIPLPEYLAKVMRDLDAINAEIKDAGGWVFTGGLHPASTATVVSYADGELLTTDGPFAEGKEHIGGFWIVNAEDLDAALGWAGKITMATRLPMEVRPFRDLREG